MGRTNSFKKTIMLGTTQGEKRRRTANNMIDGASQGNHEQDIRKPQDPKRRQDAL